jgi:hypothetical protein
MRSGIRDRRGFFYWSAIHTVPCRRLGNSGAPFLLKFSE